MKKKLDYHMKNHNNNNNKKLETNSYDSRPWKLRWEFSWTQTLKKRKNKCSWNNMIITYRSFKRNRETKFGSRTYCINSGGVEKKPRHYSDTVDKDKAIRCEFDAKKTNTN